MDYHEFTPAPALRPYVESLWSLSSEGRVAPHGAGEIYPDGRIELVVSFADPVRRADLAADAFVVGQLACRTTVDYTGVTELLGARFTPAGASAFLREDASELTGRIVSLRDVVPGALVRALASGCGRLDWFQRMLMRRVNARRDPDARIAAAASATGTIAELAAQATLGRRQFERRFERVVGLTPKLFGRIQRFHAASQAALESDTRPHWAALAQRAGYYDQSHLTRDFREFAGATPSAFWRRFHEADDAFVQDAAAVAAER